MKMIKQGVRKNVAQRIQDGCSEAHRPARVDQVTETLDRLVAVRVLRDERDESVDAILQLLLVAWQRGRKRRERAANNDPYDRDDRHDREYDYQGGQYGWYAMLLQPQHGADRDHRQEGCDQKRNDQR